MKKIVVLLVVSCLIVLSLLLASCAPAAPTAPTAPTTPTAPTGSEVPKYGGVFTFHLTSEPPRTYDDAYAGRFSTRIDAQTNMSLLETDWALGPAGTGEIDHLTWVVISTTKIGEIAESWELKGNDTAIFHIRKGIRWAVHPENEMSKLVGDREVTAHDVVFSLKRHFDMLPDYPEPRAYAAHFRLSPEEQPLSIEATDDWTVVVKGRKGSFGSTFYWVTDSVSINAPEVIKAGKNFIDPRNRVSNGPFIVTDYVEATSITFVRNPNHWRKDPIGPGKGNQLPYLDGLKIVIISDPSTAMSALRSGKLDFVRQVGRDENVDLMKTTPQLQRVATPGRSGRLAIRVDKPELPFYDKRVRQAIMMGIDRQTIVKDYFGGEAEMHMFPAAPFKHLITIGAYIPFDKLPSSTQELFQYNPDKAKKLLAEAGYPSGFKMEVILDKAGVDEATILKDQLAKIGVTLELSVKEAGVYTSILQGKQYKDAVFRTGASGEFPQSWQPFRPGDLRNIAMVDDPVINKTIAEFAEYFIFDDAKAYPMIGEVTPYILEQAWYIQFPSPYGYNVWWPWVKNFHGEWAIGNSTDGFTRFIWIDQDLKKSMGF